jgi:phage-related protein
MIRFLPGCEREIREFPVEIREDLADALARLAAGLRLAMPLSRPMPAVGQGVHELRLKGRSGSYRVIYGFHGGDTHVVHAFKKTTQETAKRNLELARKRLRGVAK